MRRVLAEGYLVGQVPCESEGAANVAVLWDSTMLAAMVSSTSAWLCRAGGGLEVGRDSNMTPKG